ncbi:peptidoglycan-binding protein [Rivularia sp. UHCC 0363]|uniref:peptidoglycan-binding domain-containing protein n=1 Tax=Rivularia sp. UHCC 0363 TaxID=3110244 RepID=UPI002B21D9AE|nr:peptidoglycan-binding protein [Rivularia sp. UHCC 0363]MEA5593980.1 peptidoglycan-binding protein [Rivularia sp. UHCC 0363]
MWCEFSNRSISVITACVIAGSVAVSSTVLAARQRNYTPREFRSVLYGLGYDVGVSDAPLTDAQAKKAIREFQQGYKLGVDGIAGPKTQDFAAEIVKSLKYNLNLVAKPNPKLRLDQFYGLTTQDAVKEYQEQLQVEKTGIADLALRQKLNQQAKQGTPQPEPEATPSPIPSPTATPEVTPTPVFPEPTPTPTESPEATPEVTPIPESTPEATPSPTATPEVTPTPVFPEATPTPTESPDDEATPTPTPTP